MEKATLKPGVTLEQLLVEFLFGPLIQPGSTSSRQTVLDLVYQCLQNPKLDKNTRPLIQTFIFDQLKKFGGEELEPDFVSKLQAVANVHKKENEELRTGMQLSSELIASQKIEIQNLQDDLEASQKDADGYYHMVNAIGELAAFGKKKKLRKRLLKILGDGDYWEAKPQNSTLFGSMSG